jgi:putative ABC transport system permease protein
LRETGLIFGDLKRRKYRTFAVVVSVAVLVSLLFSTSVLEVGARNASASGAEKLGADTMLLPPISPTTFSIETATGPILVVDKPEGFVSQGLAAQALTLPGVLDATPQLFLGKLSSANGRTFNLVAFDPSTDFVVRPWYGGRLDSLTEREAVAGSGTGLARGDAVTFGTIDLVVVGVLNPTNSSLDCTVLMPISTVQKFHAVVTNQTGYQTGDVSAVLVRLSPDLTAGVAGHEMSSSLENLRLVQSSALVSRVRSDTTGLASFELLAEVTMAASVFLMMGLVFSMTTNERERQLGLLRSLGGTSRFIFADVFKEATVMAVAGSILGLAIGGGIVLLGMEFLVATFNTSLMVPDFLGLVYLGFWAGALGVLTGAGASILPAYRTTRRDPYEAIRRGE